MNDTPITNGNNNTTASERGGFLSSKWVELAILSALCALALLFTVIFYSIKFTDFTNMYYSRGDDSFWSANVLYTEFVGYSRINHFNVYFIIAFVVGVMLYIAATTVFAVGKGRDRRLFYAAAAYNIVLSLACMICGISLEILRVGTIVFCILSIIVSMATLAFLIVRRIFSTSSGTADNDLAQQLQQQQIINTPISPSAYKLCKLSLLICSGVALAVAFTLFFVPLYSVKGVTTESYILIRSVFTYDTPLYVSIMFAVMTVAFFAEVVYFASLMSYYLRSDKQFVRQSGRFVTSTAVLTLFFFVFGFCVTFYLNLKNNGAEEQTRAFTVGFIPFILSTATMIVHAVFRGRLRIADDAANGNGCRKPLKFEPLIYAVASTAVMLISLVLDIVKIKVTAGEFYSSEVSLNGYQLLSTYNYLESGFQVMAFIEFAFLLTAGIMLAASLAFFFAKDNGYYKAVKTCAIADFLFVLIISLFGVYYDIAQKINMENIQSLLDHYEVVLPLKYDCEVKSQTIYMLIASAAVIVLMLFRGVFALDAQAQGEAAAETSGRAVGTHNGALSKSGTTDYGTDRAYDFDACPAFTELDRKRPQFQADIEKRRRMLFADPSLPELVRFVVDYARECRLHLSYSIEDMATFVAGLGSSRLAILQGMSGTGKTSLPKVFAEAILGNCEIIEVESSWRDKNELLGYYNEFSKCFTPKKFTQSLYKARLNMPVTTFIVLDEMNLSRIEYYFSDFLSLMENEEDRREIKLLNIKLNRTEKGASIPYGGLTDGHTLAVPANVWFIGTANRDESTFEISDKVYDRAQTMNFNKRAPKIRDFGAPLDQRFVPYGMLVQMFNEAKNSYKFEAEDNVLVQKTEKLLAQYNISFGNRILKQMEDFVKIYCACFGDKAAAEHEAVERILLSKVVSKLESKVVENKENLASEFDKLGLKNCGAFVRKLNED